MEPGHGGHVESAMCEEAAYDGEMAAEDPHAAYVVDVIRAEDDDVSKGERANVREVEASLRHDDGHEAMVVKEEEPIEMKTEVVVVLVHSACYRGAASIRDDFPHYL